MLLLLDNYDSFTWNVYHFLKSFKVKVKVVRNNKIKANDNNKFEKYKGIVFSPGPGKPENAGEMMNIINNYKDKIPMLGICLGHQAIGASFGAKIVKMKKVMHGKTDNITILKNSNIIKNIPRNSFSFGKDKSNDYQIKDIKQNIRVTSFKLKDNFVKKDYSFSMSMHGEHNVMNATSAIIAAIQENIDLSIIKKSLKTCSSIERRFEIVSHDIFSKKITLVDDYGHHPKEIKYSYDTASEIWKNKKKIVVFQPHRYTRTKDLFDEFIKTLLNIENLLLLDIYPASEKIIKGYEGKDLFQALKKNGSNVVFCQNHTEVIEKLENMTTGNEVIITQGAGTTSDLARKISNL